MKVMVVTTNDYPGMTVKRMIGPVYGTAVRSRNVVGSLLGGIASIFGGKQQGATTMVSQTRDDALIELEEKASRMGANAVLAMRFDAGEFDSGQGVVMEMVTAYGTAVVLEPIIER